MDSLAFFLLVYSIITHQSSSITFLSLQELLNCGKDLHADQVRANIAILHAALEKLAAGCDDEFKFYIVALNETNLNYLIAMLERALVSNERCFLMALMTCCRKMETFGAPITHNKPVADCCPTTKNFTTLFAALPQKHCGPLPRPIPTPRRCWKICNKNPASASGICSLAVLEIVQIP